MAVRIPRGFTEDLGLSEGKQVIIARHGDSLTIRPVKIPHYSLKELLKGMKPFKLSKEDREWLDAPPMGREII